MPPDRHRRRGNAESIVRPWPVDGQERRSTLVPLARATALYGSQVQVGRVVSISFRSGLRPALVHRLFDVVSGTSTRTFAHVQSLTTSYAGEELFIQARACQNVKVSTIASTQDTRPRFVLDAAAATWRDPLPPARHCPVDVTKADPFSLTACDSCLAAEDERMRQPRVLDTPDCPGFTKDGEEFHVGDLVFFAPDDIYTGQAWTPGVLTRSHRRRERGVEWGVRVCGRFADLPDARRRFVDENRLFLTEDGRYVPLPTIMGKAIVNGTSAAGFTCRELLPRGTARSRKSILPLPHRDYVAPSPCQQCTAEQAGVLDGLRPPAVDLYAGAGGFLSGVARHFDVRHAVEMDATACATLRANFPNVRVHYSKVDEYSRGRGRQPPAAVGSVGLLVAGPPCQGLSASNHHRALDNVLNEEVFTALREVARVRPDVFILENVPGICMPLADGRGSVNIMQRVVRILVGELGYQVRVGQLSAREYGSPQHRKRIFVIAARSGLTLPQFPAPTHANPDASVLEFEVGEGRAYLGAPRRGCVPGTAARPAVTARDAIGDMPEWDCTNLGALYDNGSGIGVRDGTPYRRAPFTNYQRAARRAAIGVRDHVTRWPAQYVLDSVFSAPRADQLPVGRGSELRCDPNGALPTVQGSPKPGGKATRVIHWSRLLSVAERRRVQGLPDAYVLQGTVKQKDAMLGNMVDVHVADALARHVKAEVYGSFWRANGRPDQDEFWRLWRERYPV